MFSPLDLPIWGGINDSNRIVSATRVADGNIRLDFGNKDDPYATSGAGYVVVDLELGIVTEMTYHRSRFTTSDMRATALAGSREPMREAPSAANPPQHRF